AEPDREYVALLTYLPLRAYRSIPRFLVSTIRIGRQLARAPGAIGYSLRASMGSKQFWTLSVWESEAALGAFVAARPHLDAMSGLRGHMGATRFTRWRVRGRELPPDWSDALRRERAT
ncbi:MAG TPA: antibiotic biosynthesis monooxygenase, partial [Planctomycetota bacterium]|nr:antibiotic biosynthesis monooxygenase [Planctomycetota bacterium]